MVKSPPASKTKRNSLHPWVRKIPWRRAWQLTGESHGQRSLAAHGPQGHKELDMTEAPEPAHTHPLHDRCKFAAPNSTDDFLCILIRKAESKKSLKLFSSKNLFFSLNLKYMILKKQIT